MDLLKQWCQTMKSIEMMNRAVELIDNLISRGFDTRERLFRKLAEEVGEVAESIEYCNGSTRKVEKFKGKATPKEKLNEEIIDVFIVVIALGRVEGLSISDMIDGLVKKLSEQRKISESEEKI